MLGAEPVAPDFRAFLRTLRNLGWIDGQNVVIDRRSAERNWDQVPALFADVVRQEPDVIVAVTHRMAVAAKQATSTIPIVATMSRALENRLAASLARPGGNLTGIDAQAADQALAASRGVPGEAREVEADQGVRLVLEKGDDAKEFRRALKAAAAAVNKRVRFPFRGEEGALSFYLVGTRGRKAKAEVRGAPRRKRGRPRKTSG